MTGLLRNQYTSIDFNFIINVINDPPFFDSNPTNQQVSQYEEGSYVLPSPKDNEGQSISITTNEIYKNILPAFVKFDVATRTYSFSPIVTDKPDKYFIQVILGDTFGAKKTYIFTVEVTASHLNYSVSINSTTNDVK
jgi:Putative Ig domain